MDLSLDRPSVKLILFSAITLRSIKSHRAAGEDLLTGPELDVHPTDLQ